MIPESALVSLFFAVLAHGASIESLNAFGGLRLGSMVTHTKDAKEEISLIENFVNKADPPRADTTNSQFPSWGCLYDRQQFVRAAEGGLEILINAHEDKSDNGPASIDISESVATVDTTSAGWTQEGSTTFGTEASASVGFGGFGASLAASYSRSNSQGQNGEKSKQQEYRKEISTTRDCPKNTRCSVQTWTYMVSLKGRCPRVPTVDPVCWNEKVTAKDPLWFPATFPAYNLLKEKNLLRGNLSLPSVNQQDDTWDAIGEKYYTMTKKDGSPAGKVLPSSNIVDGVWWPSDKDYTVDYKDSKSCDIMVPLLKPDGQPRTSQVLLKVTGGEFQSVHAKRADDDIEFEVIDVIKSVFDD